MAFLGTVDSHSMTFCQCLSRVALRGVQNFFLVCLGTSSSSLSRAPGWLRHLPRTGPISHFRERRTPDSDGHLPTGPKPLLCRYMSVATRANSADTSYT